MTAPSMSAVLDGAVAQAREWSASSDDTCRLSRQQVGALADAVDAGRSSASALRAVVRLLNTAEQSGAKVVCIDAVRHALLFGETS